MTLIEGIGDEVTQFFLIVFVIFVVTVAWWTTNISEQRHVRTVLLLERRRHRTHRRLTNHTEAVTITEDSTVVQIGTNQVNHTGEDPSPSEQSSTSEITPNTVKTSDPGAGGSTELPTEDFRGAQRIIDTMDADNCVLRQRRLAFYDSRNSDSQSGSESQTADLSSEAARIEEVQELDSPVVMEHNYAEHSSTLADESLPLNPQEQMPVNQTGITVKLKYLNDDLKTVDGKLDEMLGDFKKRHFQHELSNNKIVRLIFNGQVLQPDTQTLGGCGLFDNCVVHCLIHQKRSSTNEPVQEESRRDGYSFPNPNAIPNFNNNNQNRDWDLGNFLFAFVSFILLAAWYFRYVYAHLYTVTATVGLILITGIFTIWLVGLYFPDNENVPNLTIRIAREQVPPAPPPPPQQ